MKTFKQITEETENHIGGPGTKKLLNSHGFHYSGDMGKHGPEYSSKSGGSYQVFAGKWHHHTGTSGNTLASLKDHLNGKGD